MVTGHETGQMPRKKSHIHATFCAPGDDKFVDLLSKHPPA